MNGLSSGLVVSFSFPIIYIRTPQLVRDKTRNPNKFGHPSTGILHISKLIS